MKQSPYQDGFVWVCWSWLVFERFGGAVIHAQSMDHGGHRTLCGVSTDKSWWGHAIHGPGDAGVTCERCIRIAKGHEQKDVAA